MVIKAVVVQVIILVFGIGLGLVSHPYIFKPEIVVTAEPVEIQTSAVEELAREELKTRKIQARNARRERQDRLVMGKHNCSYSFGSTEYSCK